MIRALMTAASGMKAQQKQVDTIANNIANVNTGGFKKSNLAFRSMLYQTYREPGASTNASQMNPTGLQIGSGVEISGSTKDFRQGELEPTGAPFDLSIQGEGFFEITLGNGEVRYTRDGSFRRDGNGKIVTPEGYPVTGAPEISPTAIDVIVTEDGRFLSRDTEGQVPTEIGKMQLYRFSNPSGLKAQGGNLYSLTASSGVAVTTDPGNEGTGILRQGYRERANVETVDELVGLILAQRNYEVNSRAVRVSDEMLQQVNQMIR
jgi:flagellar basal-body rod protein FlgG